MGMIVSYPLIVNELYFMIANSMSIETVADIDGVNNVNSLFPYCSKVANLLSECWVSIYTKDYASDIFILCS